MLFLLLHKTPKRCWERKDSIGSPIKPMGVYGDYQCDSPWALVESAVHAMKSKHGDVDFILWTG
ncbi:hypothetical protein RUM43_001163 [Polyplax serrata]|uniref:Uncharacterized protein n=1 Tax=Polyplax serrata TaxID=468196 RepID=A0AAN8SH93_POLSC